MECKDDIIEAARKFTDSSEYNYVSEQAAISQKSVGMRIFDMPVLAFGSPQDRGFHALKEPKAIGEHFMLPLEWLPEANTVISFFLPFTQAVRDGNKKDKELPSEEWLHARIEGQTFVNKLCLFLKSELTAAGYESIVPTLDDRFFSKTANCENPADALQFTSNWSERHVAFVCGLGTFGLSKGLITEKGVAGRLGSVITRLEVPADKRKYERLYEYCNMCGKCAANCPVNAISVEKGKNHHICSDHIDATREKYKPRYGCGKCQVNVPCENHIPQHFLLHRYPL